MDDNRKDGNGVKKPVSILFLADSHSYHAARWLRYFADKGYRVMIYDAINRPSGIDGVEVVQPDWKDDPNIPYPQRLAHILVDLGLKLNELRPDVLHGHFLVNWGWWGAFSGYRPLVTTVWGSDINIGTKHSDFHRRANRLALLESDLVTTDSAELMATIDNLADGRANSRLIYWGIDSQKFRPGIDTNSFRDKYSLDSGPIILSPRNLQPNFNIDSVVGAFSRVADKFPQALLVIKSYPGFDPAYEKKVTDLITCLGLDRRVRRLHDLPDEDMPALYNVADITVLVPDYDGSACAMLESLACATPVIAGRIDSMREWITDGENGFLVDQHNPDQLAERIEKILASPETGRKLGERGRAIVEERGNVHIEWGKMDRLYRRLDESDQASLTPDYTGSETVKDYLVSAASAIANGDTGRAFDIYLSLIEGLYQTDPESLEHWDGGRD